MGSEKKFGFGSDKTNLVANLMTRPTRDRGPKIQVPFAGMIAQADLLMMPSDSGFRYILVVVDTGNRMTDAVPITTKSSAAVTRAFNTIFERGIIPKPRVIQVDPGSEFKGQTKASLEKSGIWIRVGKTGRHRQQALVEARNRIIGRALFYRMTSREVVSGKVNKQWRSELPELIEYLNKRYKIDPEETKKELLEAEPQCEGKSCELIPEGTKVRVILDEPRDLFGKKLVSGFRATDIRWDPVVREIEQLLIKPGFPPMYLVSGIKNVSYTRAQLQVIPKGEVAPESRKKKA